MIMSFTPPKGNSPLKDRLLCKVLHDKKEDWEWKRGPMGWVDWYECKKCNTIHEYG